MKNIILHFPFKIEGGRAAASQLRPVKMVDTFKGLGYNVHLIEGYGKERRSQILEIKSAIKSGVKFEFMYSECNTSPTLLTEKHHLPTYPFLDFSFFKFCKQNGIKIGLFYRDIYWCFPENVKGWKAKVAHWFYEYDLREYNKYVSALFVPSEEMVKYIPAKLRMPTIELYPGCDIQNVAREQTDNDGKIHVLYIGGIGHHYDVSMMMKAAKEMDDIDLTICCRADDWEAIKDEYQELMNDNTHVVHKSGEELKTLYKRADLFCLFVRPDKYWEFAVPYKLFETIGYGCPLIASEGTWVAKFVKEHGIGVVADYSEEALKTALRGLMAERGNLQWLKQNVANINANNTWEARCKMVETVLTR